MAEPSEEKVGVGVVTWRRGRWRKVRSLGRDLEHHKEGACCILPFCPQWLS